MERSLAELETVVRNRICGVCSNRLSEPRPSGTGPLSGDLCGLENPAECALFRLFPQVAQAIQSTNSDNLQDYIDAIRQSVCTVCKSQDSSGDCESRQEVQCALDAYLLLVVEAIEEATGKSFGQPLPPATVHLV